ncbi:hypothetical protein C9J85_03905 [Haloferax sp. wsp5]|nr:hypothetical protein C9J85_03905 [Haloferax sp. wsp5]
MEFLAYISVLSSHIRTQTHAPNRSRYVPNPSEWLPRRLPRADRRPATASQVLRDGAGLMGGTDIQTDERTQRRSDGDSERIYSSSPTSGFRVRRPVDVRDAVRAEDSTHGGASTGHRKSSG